MIELIGVALARGGSTVHDGLFLAVDAGQVVLVSGAAGKTSLLDLVCGRARADAGVVQVFGRDVGRLRASSVALLRRRLGLVTQLPELLSEQSALANVAIAAEVAGASAPEARAMAAAALAEVGLADRVDAPASELSGGERQRVALARALAKRPEIALWDEPTTHLADDQVDRLVDVMESEQARGCALVAVTTDTRLLAHADRPEWRHLTLESGQLHAGDGVPGGVVDACDTIPNVVPFPIPARVGGAAK